MTIINMAAPRLLKTLSLRPFCGYVFARHSSSSLVPDTKQKVMDFFLRRYVADMDHFMQWKHDWKQWVIELKNEGPRRVEMAYGKIPGVVYYTLAHKGAVRNLKYLDISDLPKVSHKG
ncbi:unnamed protein product, partial [Staurois parvus]